MNRLEIAIQVMKANMSAATVVGCKKETFVKYCFDIAETMLAEEAKRKEEENKPKEDPEGWIKWNGVEFPVDTSDFVDIQFRNGNMSTNVLASKLRWEHANTGPNSSYYPDYDIIAYRVIK